MNEMTYFTYENLKETVKNFFIALGTLLSIPIGMICFLLGVIYVLFSMYFNSLKQDTYDFYYKHGEYIKAIENEDIELVQKYIDDPEFDIYNTDLYGNIGEVFGTNKIYFHESHCREKDYNGINLALKIEKYDIFIRFLSSPKAKLNEQDLNDYFNITKDLDTLKFLLEKIKHHCFNTNKNIISTKLNYILEHFKQRGYDFISENIEFFIENEENSFIVFNECLNRVDINLLDVLMKHNYRLETSKKLEFNKEMNKAFLLKLQEFENFDDFLRINRNSMLRICDDEAIDYLMTIV